MLNRLDGQYLFVLPLPLTAPGKNARLYGVALCRTDANLNPLSEYEILKCKLPYNALPSPAYLYSLDLNVNLLRDGICESKFINCLNSHFDNKNLTIVTFSARHLQALNAISLRCFLSPNILQKPKSVFDVKTALNVASIFGVQSFTAQSDLIANAKIFNLYENEKANDHIARLKLLIKLFKKIITDNYKIASFLLRPTYDKLNFIKKSISSKDCLVLLDNSAIKIIKPIKLHNTVLYALTCNSEEELKYEAIDLDLMYMIAPLGILTPDRVQKLQLNLSHILSLLNNAPQNLALNTETIPYKEKFFMSLNAADLSFYDSIGKKDPRSLYPNMETDSQVLSNHLFLYRCENFQGTLTNQELNKYYDYCVKKMHKDLPVFLKEAKMLANNLEENDEEGLKQIRSIIKFAEEL